MLRGVAVLNVSLKERLIWKATAKDVHVVMFVEVKESFRRNGVEPHASFASHRCRKPILIDPVLNLRLSDMEGRREALH
jgi:hypothetical protein